MEPSSSYEKEHRSEEGKEEQEKEVSLFPVMVRSTGHQKVKYGREAHSIGIVPERSVLGHGSRRYKSGKKSMERKARDQEKILEYPQNRGRTDFSRAFKSDDRV
ncbi:hypothetical protein F2Q70_00022240 [Brassica cretica]|uniref:Uncharacterized protein n=1 Tax=Brassica cretica TaxID=69181 RepID=A0A8S9GIE4_BRACR|nr:hypothetical protein F2Q70_00022240 [Brassica cretica]